MTVSITRRQLLIAASAAGVLSLVPGPALAVDANKDREQAQAMVEEAITLFRDQGADAVIDAVNAPGTSFLKGDLYVFIIGPNGRTVAHGFDQSRVGLAVANLVDQDGKPYGKELLKATPEGLWVDYKWLEPTTRKFEPKSSWVKRYDDYIFGCGVYKQS